MTNQRSALLRLLDDDDPATLSLLKGQLMGAGLERLGEFKELLPQAAGAAGRHLREVIAGIEAREAEALFGQLCADFGENGDVEEAAWGLAAAFTPGEDFARQRGLLDSWAAEVQRRNRKADSDVDRIETLVEFLGHDLGLHGDEKDYYNINHSLLPEVIDTRRGIPISLSLIYLLVGRRVGLKFDGVGLPGHFIVRSGEHFFDPFNGGRRLGIEQCRAIVERHGVPLRSEYFRPVTPRLMLTRMLANIVALAQESDPPLAAKVAGWVEALNRRE
jgi:regulator of sirC expression with transglutaminase-like and TPR domain